MTSITRKMLDGIKKNHDTICSFIDVAASHNGRLNPRNLFKVKGDTLEVELAKTAKPETRSLIIGIEPCNSYSPIYELDYFLMAFFLSTVATTLPLAEYARIQDMENRMKRIRIDLESISALDLERAMQSPVVAIVGILTDDIEPYRYRKDQLWGFGQTAMKKRSIDVCIEELRCVDLPHESRLWAGNDLVHAYQAIQHARSLCEAKMIQSYLSIGKFLGEVGVDIAKVPLFFSLTPNGDLRNLANAAPFLDILLELHSPPQYTLLRKILRWNYPRIIGLSCPNCGESSKKIINGAIKGEDKRAIRLVCSEKPKTFKNEAGMDTIQRKGCNYRWDLVLPSNRDELHKLLSDGFSLYFPINSLFWLINDLSFAPSALLFTDAGFHKVNGRIELARNLPIGDHAVLLINMMMLQRLFLENVLCPHTSGCLRGAERLVNQAPLLIGHQHPTQLFDPALKFQTADGRSFHVTDSSIFAALKHGLTPEMILDRSFNLCDFPTTQLMVDMGMMQALNKCE